MSILSGMVDYLTTQGRRPCSTVPISRVGGRPKFFQVKQTWSSSEISTSQRALHLLEVQSRVWPGHVVLSARSWQGGTGAPTAVSHQVGELYVESSGQPFRLRIGLLLAEARLAAAALGLDPGLGVLHYDTPGRDSLACDLMEPVRPQVDAFLLDWITRQALKREWFFEERSGNCRLMAEFATRLSETAPTWGRAVAPYVEWTAQTLWSRRKRTSNSGPATPLTQRHRREAKGKPPLPLTTPAPRPSVCRTCGTSIPPRACYCGPCGVAAANERLRTASYEGREKSRGEEAQTKRAESQRRHMLARLAWHPSKESSPIEEEGFLRDVQPRLATLRVGAIRLALGISKAYASAIRAGKRRPHPRHWQTLAELAGASSDA
jgi:hypothetical protein